MKSLLRHCCFATVLLVATAATLRSQTSEWVGNQFVTANLLTVPKCGKFWISSGSSSGSTKYLFQAGNQVTSNIVFRVERSGSVNYYSNVDPSLAGVPKPQVPGTANGATYKPYDSMYVSPAHDTLSTWWRQMDGYTVIMRFVAEKPSTIYDNGGDLLLEFEYHLDPFAPSATLGIFMMLDTYNSNTPGSGTGGGDRSSILTDTKYFDANLFGASYNAPIDTIPAWYHVGNFRYELSQSGQLNTVFPVHRLRGKSHGGAPLTPPNAFAIGNWDLSFKYTGWAIPSDVGSTQINDCATITRWENMYGDGVIRTAFGTSDQSGNNHYICRDSSLCVVINTIRLSQQVVQNGPYIPQQFDVEAWIINTDQDSRRPNTIRTPTVRLVSPIQSFPGNTGRLLLDPTTPASQTVTLQPREVKKIIWRLNVNPGSSDTLAQLALRYRLSGGTEKVFKQNCSPLVTIKGYQVPAQPRDTIAPVILRTSTGGSKSPWTFRTFDRHPGYKYDTGLDKIVVETNDANNFKLTWTPSPFTRCDTNITVDLTATVQDTTKPAHIIFAVYDCAGNLSRDTAVFAPRPDIFVPEIVRIDSITPTGMPPCNTRMYSVQLLDSSHQTPAAGDYGFGTIEVLSLSNFKPIDINYDRGNAPINPYDPRSSFRLEVQDTMMDASALVRVADVVGNSDTLAFDYCTQPDIRKPILSASKIDYRSWNVGGSDTLGWDRGLLNIIELSNTNMSFTPPVIVPGQPTTQFNVSVIDDTKNASITLLLQDTYFATDSAMHSDVLTLVYTTQPDTMAPNIIFTPVPGSNGSVADVEVNDIHYINGNWYKYDLGLSNINSIGSPNIILATPIVFNAADSITTFRIQVVDTLALQKNDSICIDATDLAGNRSTNCYYYPLIPDRLNPVFIGTLSPDRRTLSGTISDTRLYDRGLGSISIDNSTNLDVSQLPPNIRALPQSLVSVPVLDPTKPIAGTITLHDLIAVVDNTPGILVDHETKLTFSLPIVSLALSLPQLVQGGETIHAPVVLKSTFLTSEVDSVNVTVDISGAATYSKVDSKGTDARVDAVSATKLQLTLTPKTGRTYQPGDTLCILDFNTVLTPSVGKFNLKLSPGTGNVNAGLGRAITEPKSNSVLNIPSPYFIMTNDSLTFVNGSCQQVLAAHQKAAKQNVIEILGIRPQPITVSGSKVLEIDVTNLPVNAKIEFVSPLGYRKFAAQSQVVATAGEISRLHVTLDDDIPSGVFFLRVVGNEASNWAKIMVAK